VPGVIGDNDTSLEPQLRFPSGGLGSRRSAAASFRPFLAPATIRKALERHGLRITIGLVEKGNFFR
jgi:hypothetical protein